MTDEDFNAFQAGQFRTSVLDHLAGNGRWMDTVGYLKRCITYHARASMVQAPYGASTEQLVLVHSELFLSPHRQIIFELIAQHDVPSAQHHFGHHLAPLLASVPGARGRLSTLFTNVDDMMDRMMLPALPKYVSFHPNLLQQFAVPFIL